MLLAAYIGTGQIMGWGNKAIEIRSAETGHLDGVFMHKKDQKLKFLCERNDKVRICFALTSKVFFAYNETGFFLHTTLIVTYGYISINLSFIVFNLFQILFFRGIGRISCCQLF